MVGQDRSAAARPVRALVALVSAVLLAAAVVLSGDAAAPTALEGGSFVSGLGAAADSAIAGMRSLWGTASSALAAAPRAGTGAVHFRNVNLALSSAGQAALMAQQVSACLPTHASLPACRCLCPGSCRVGPVSSTPRVFACMPVS